MRKKINPLTFFVFVFLTLLSTSGFSFEDPTVGNAKRMIVTYAEVMGYDLTDSTAIIMDETDARDLITTQYPDGYWSPSDPSWPVPVHNDILWYLENEHPHVVYVDLVDQSGNPTALIFIAFEPSDLITRTYGSSTAIVDLGLSIDTSNCVIASDCPPRTTGMSRTTTCHGCSLSPIDGVPCVECPPEPNPGWSQYPVHVDDDDWLNAIAIDADLPGWEDWVDHYVTYGL